MNNLRNKVQLIGRIGQAPEIISFENGKKLARISIATNERYKNAAGEKVEDVQWHSLTAWGKKASFIEDYVIKGQAIAIEGKLVNRAYRTRDGEKRQTTEIQISDINLFGRSVEGKKRG